MVDADTVTQPVTPVEAPPAPRPVPAPAPTRRPLPRPHGEVVEPVIHDRPQATPRQWEPITRPAVPTAAPRARSTKRPMPPVIRAGLAVTVIGAPALSGWATAVTASLWPIVWLLLTGVTVGAVWMVMRVIEVARRQGRK